MGTLALKPVKIKLNNNMASGMYILLNKDEIKYTKSNETKPPNRNYKIQINTEAVYKSKRCTGKKSFNIPRRTSIAKAVNSLLGKREEMKEMLRSKGTLKNDKTLLPVQTKSKDRTLGAVFDNWLSIKSLETSKNTIASYKGNYNGNIRNTKFDKIIGLM